MSVRPLLPLPDYQRIYQVIYSVLEASEIAITHRACIFFASVGTLILRDQYHLPATISAGCMALMVDEQAANVVVYGRNDGGAFVADKDGFHAWVECKGWLIDFMAPIMGVGLREDGSTWKVPSRMLQKRLADSKASLGDIQHAGDFFVSHDRGLAESLLDGQPVLFEDLANVCMTWFRRPPKAMKPLALGDSHGSPKPLVLRVPAIDGSW